MARAARTLALVALLSGVAVTASPKPATAAVTVTVTSAGNVVTVTATGSGQISFGCDGLGTFRSEGVNATPAVNCSSVTRVNVNGDSGAQSVLGFNLDRPEFAANPYLNVSLGGGDDRLTETDRADVVDMGADNDTVFIKAGGLNNGIVTMGTGSSDSAYFDGTDGPDAISASSTDADVSVTVTSNDGGSTRSVQDVDFLFLRGEGGDDTINPSGVTNATAVTGIVLMGGKGNDTLTAGVRSGNIYGNEGTNLLKGGPAADTFRSYSETDTIQSGTSGTDEIIDEQSGRSGTRTLSGSSLKKFTQRQIGCDAQTRVRSAGAGTSTVVSSLCRPGIQPLPTSVQDITVLFDDPVKNKALADVIIPGSQSVDVRGDSFHDDLLDITVPTGGWTSTGTAPNTVTINPTSSNLGNVTYEHMGPVAVHGPWSSKDQSFGHRIIRDLQYRFPGTTEREAIRTSLTNGTKTRGQVVSATMNTDEYRGNDVDRVFVRFLGRAADPSGRTYWINGLRNGKSLQKFRAQLFGSNEYFVKATSSNLGFVRAAYFDVLGRLPDPAGETYWVNKINNGTDRGSVANAFLASTEARRAIVKDQFQRFVLRLPTTAESEQWVNTLASPTGEQSLIAFLAASGAYYNAG